MKKLVLLMLVLCVHAVNAQSTSSIAARNVQSKSSQTLPIKRVVLYSNGVAYVERRGFVTGDTSVDLSFKQSQVDDVLKSMIVLDLGEGQIGAVSYNSSAPPSARMAEIPFSVLPRTDGSGGNGGIAGVLAQLQGANVLVTVKGVSVRGAILTVERHEVKSEKESKVINNLVIASETGGIMSFDLAEVRGVKLLDQDTKRDVSEFAGATASSRRRDAKTITVTSRGAGRREMMVSYTIAAPIWKTTYRVVLDEQGQPFFQGWAIVDNVSEEDWEGVQLSLVSGSPISFIQDIQRPFYRYRPVVPMPKGINVTPQVYETGKESGFGETSGGFVDSKSKSTKVVDQTDNAIGSNFSVDGASGASNTFTVNGREVTDFRTGVVSEALSNQSSGVTTAASGEEIGDFLNIESISR